MTCRRITLLLAPTHAGHRNHLPCLMLSLCRETAVAELERLAPKLSSSSKSLNEELVAAVARGCAFHHAGDLLARCRLSNAVPLVWSCT